MDNKLQMIYGDACQASGSHQKLVRTWEEKISRLNTKIGHLNISLHNIRIKLIELEQRIEECEKERIENENESREFLAKAKEDWDKANDSVIKGAYKLGVGSGGSMALGTALSPLTGGASIIVAAVVGVLAAGSSAGDFKDAFDFSKKAKQCDERAANCATTAANLRKQRDTDQQEKNIKEQEKGKFTKKRDEKQLEMDLLRDVSRKLDSIKTNIESVVKAAVNK